MEHTREAAPLNQEEIAGAEREAAPPPVAGKMFLETADGRWKASSIFVRPNF